MANIGRISTYGLHNTTLRDASRTQEQLAQLQIQLSSGLKTQSFAGMSNEAEQFVALEAKLTRTELYISNNKVVVNRLDTTSAVLGQAIETVTSLRNLILQRRNTANAGNMAFPEQLEGLWQSLAGQLNSTLEGRYLFSGTRSETPPVDYSTFPTLQEDGVPDAGYYHGNSDSITLRADDSVAITYNVRADESGFQKAVAAFVMASQGDLNDYDTDLAAAYDLASEALQEIISIQARTNANKISVEQVVERQSALSLYWKGLKEEISNADLVTVSTQVAINQGILQASFQAFAKINSLRLSDYLR